MMRAYKAKSIAGAERRVRQLQAQINVMNQILDRWKAERNLLARLAATGQAFFNPLDAMAAEKLRNELLASLGMHPDGTFK